VLRACAYGGGGGGGRGENRPDKTGAAVVSGFRDIAKSFMQ